MKKGEGVKRKLDENSTYKKLDLNDKKLLLKHARNRLLSIGKKKFWIDGKEKGVKNSKASIVIDFYMRTFNICPIKYYFNERLRLNEFEDTEETFVYIIGNIEKRFCKIGFSKNPSKRLKGIQTGCPFEVKLLCYYQGDRITEQRIHEKYKELRLHGEWFKLHGELLNVVQTENLLKSL